MAKVLTMSEIAALANVAAGTERKIVTPHTQHAIYNPFFSPLRRRYNLFGRYQGNRGGEIFCLGLRL